MDKFEEFQSTLAKSNEVFTTFRQEMEKVRARYTSPVICQWQTDFLFPSFFWLCLTDFPTNCLDLPLDDQEDQEAGEGNNTVEDQMGE